jgi:hypothetical protein
MRYHPVFSRLSLLTAISLAALLVGGNYACNHLAPGLRRETGPIADSGEINRNPAAGEFSQDQAASFAGPGPEDASDPWDDAETVVRAFARAYPDRIEEVAYRNGDWALRIGAEWFYHAGGKMLREDLLGDADSYAGYSFYPYRPELPELRQYSEEEIAELEARVDEQGTSGIGRHMGLLDAIWEVYDYESSDASVKTLYLFRRQVNVHRRILEDLAEIEARVYELAREDEQLRRYLLGIGNITGHNWRQILGTSSRSLHAYGIAVDILPGRYTSAQVYWRWARQAGLPWYSLPYDQRMMPPESFIREFERGGFVWGGKWRRFDTIHFEYRPEIFELNRQFWD